MASKLPSILLGIISPNQVAFVKGRSIHEHIALGHEMIRRRNVKMEGGSFGLKLDISKAFDQLNRKFLFISLQNMGFSNIWIDWIKECVFTPKESVLINKYPCGFFSRGYGLCQGDPHSPYLFILAEEILNHNLSHSCLIRMIQPIYKPKGHALISHLLYADVILLFARAPKICVEELKRLSKISKISRPVL